MILVGRILDWLPGSPRDLVDFSRTVQTSDGEILQIFLNHQDKYRCWQELSFYPPRLIQAMLIQEDRWFYAHPGINPLTLISAAHTSMILRNRQVGASTITMQLARIIWKLDTRTIPGKLWQMVCALWLECRYSKQEILTTYLNLVPCGGNIEGFPAAAWRWFGKTLKQLDLGEMLMLAVLPQDPEDRYPRDGSFPVEAMDARRLLWTRWLEEHPEDQNLSPMIDSPPGVVEDWRFNAPHHARWLDSICDPGQTTVVSTINLQIQAACEETLHNYLETRRNEGVRNGALMVVDWTTMELKASIGSADFHNEIIQGQVDGTRSRRSPGSTLKPFIYGLALDQGLIHSNSMLRDSPVSFSEYTPDNYGRDFMGPVKAWRALGDSRNIPAVDLAARLTDQGLWGFLKKAGVGNLKEPSHYGLSIVLGSAELDMGELIRLYASLARGGIQEGIRQYWSRGTGDSGENPGSDQNGQTVGKRRLLSREASWIVLRMLEDNPSPLGARRADMPSVAWKTGTSIGFKDAWAVGICGPWLAAVWLGNFDGSGNPAFNGRQLAGPLLFRCLEYLSALSPDGAQAAAVIQARAQPAGVRQVDVCQVSGALPGPYCNGTEKAWFIPGISPIASCDIHREVIVDLKTGYRVDHDIPGQTLRQVREFWPGDLMICFEMAGLARMVPPAWGSEALSPGKPAGYPPRISSPLANTTYILQPERPDLPDLTDLGALSPQDALSGAAGALSPQESRSTLALIAHGDADSPEVLWFAGNRFLGRSRSGKPLFWRPPLGRQTIWALDSQGRGSRVDFSVEIQTMGK